MERFRIKCYMVKWFASMEKEQPFFIWLTISNKSKLPCSIHKITLECRKQGETITAVSQGNEKLIVSSRKDDKTTEYYSLGYPLDIDGYKSVGGYIHFQSESSHFNFEEQTVKVKIFTNRGNYTSKLVLKHGNNIFRVWQHRNGVLPMNLLDQNHNPIAYIQDDI